MDDDDTASNVEWCFQGPSGGATNGEGWCYEPRSTLPLRATAMLPPPTGVCYHLVAEVLQRTNDNAANSPRRCYQQLVTVLQKASEVLPAGVGMLPAVHR
jgi:hypothetical protein